MVAIERTCLRTGGATERKIRRDYPDRPFVGVGAVIWHGADVLLVKRGKPPRLGEWSIPGGAQHLGETLAEAVHREVREETGLEIRIIGVAGVIDVIDRDEAGAVRHHYSLIDMAAEALSRDARPGDDALEAIWVRPHELHAYGLWEETVRMIVQAAALRTPEEEVRS